MGFLVGWDRSIPGCTRVLVHGFTRVLEYVVFSRALFSFLGFLALALALPCLASVPSPRPLVCPGLSQVFPLH